MCEGKKRCHPYWQSGIIVLQIIHSEPHSVRDCGRQWMVRFGTCPLKGKRMGSTPLRSPMRVHGRYWPPWPSCVHQGWEGDPRGGGWHPAGGGCLALHGALFSGIADGGRVYGRIRGSVSKRWHWTRRCLDKGAGRGRCTQGWPVSETGYHPGGNSSTADASEIRGGG